MSAEHSLTLTEGLHAPSHARAWVSMRTSHLPQDAVEDALLIVSELVTNAVRHGGDAIVVTVIVPAGTDGAALTGTAPGEAARELVRIAVFDDGAALPVVTEGRPSADRPTGRGLLIVAATASDWGVERHLDRPGKTVWATVAVTGA